MSVINKKAGFQYQLGDETVEAGIMLKGGEAKAVRHGRADLSQAVIKIVDGELFLVNANIPVDGALKYAPTRMRKLLLHRAEMLSLITHAKQQKLQFVPTKLYNKGRFIKLELTLGKSKSKFEKKDVLKRKDIDRELEREFKLR
jgi:SsrA-binding protein